ncbi:hypothetical protein B0J14DRAFT_658465 [Halenospora varia]|nr:hypothetical protein B0J14DRAFT_658465 [Halenospora varia]
MCIEDLVLGLIGALQTLPPARVLRSRIDRKTRLRADLFSLGSKAGSSDFDIKSTIPLVELVVNNAPDVEIWRAVFDLIALTSPKQLTPPTAFENAVFDTPLRSSSASQRGIEQTHDKVDQRILEELTGRDYYDVGVFTSDTSKGRPGRPNRRICTNSREASMYEVAGAGDQSPHFKVHFLSGS